MIKCILSLSLLVAFTAHSAEPDESGIGGTGVKQPIIDTEIFNRPEIPELIEIPEAPDITAPERAIPDFDAGAIEQIETPESPAN